MVIVLKHDIKPAQKDFICGFLKDKGFRIKEIVGDEETILGAVGTIPIDLRTIEIMEGVSHVIPISKPYKLASREFQKKDTIVPVGPIKIGGGRICIMAGPCAIESREQIFASAEAVRNAGAVVLRGGAYKPRTSPYAFQGMGEEGLKLLKEAGEKYSLPVATEIVAAENADMMKDYVDIFQIGARNMQNFELLKKVGSLGKAVLLKRGLCATIQEWLMAAEYLMAHGTDNVILCERGIRTYETYTRNTLDISAIPVIKALSHLPIIVDPSHAVGIREKVAPVSLGSIAAGADGLIIEVHPDPDKAFSDGPQSLYPQQFEKLMRDIEAIAPVIGKELSCLPQDRAYGPTVAAMKSSDSLSIAFQGERGAYSEKALKQYFHDTPAFLPKPCNQFRDVFTSVLHGECEYGILPVENALAGSVHENYDLMLQFPDIRIVGQTQIRIRHNLIVVPGATEKDIKKVYSHPQGLKQCAAHFEKNPSWQQVSFYDTAGSVAYIAEQKDKSLAAIASEEAAAVYKMQILKEGIEDNPHNYTRFVIITREEKAICENPNMASLVFSLQDKAGALVTCLSVLRENGINMRKLESRPIHGKPWTYMFYVDVEVPSDIGIYEKALKALETETEDLRVLGLYKM